MKCCETVEEIKLSEEEFKRVKEVILKNVITDDAYRISDPIEMRIFTKFIQKHKSYDFIIDGLNLINGIVSSKSEFKVLLTRLKMDDKKVLVIGRIHLKKELEKHDLLNLADFFFVQNMSNDDAFLLYATFSSGNGVSIISEDLMRQYKFTFSNVELEVLFKRWQMVHQYTIHKKSRNLMKLHLVTPIDSYVLKKNNCWHIPYHSKFTIHPTKTHSCNTDNWACFNMRT